MLALLAASPAAAGTVEGPYRLDILDEAGRILPTWERLGRSYVHGAQGQRYSIRVHNDSGRRVEAVISVDGRIVGNGKPGPLTKKLLSEFQKRRSQDGIAVPYVTGVAKA
jgi:hypothetical protein